MGLEDWAECETQCEGQRAVKGAVAEASGAVYSPSMATAALIGLQVTPERGEPGEPAALSEVA